MENDVLISPDQAVRLMALANMLRDKDLSFRGHEEEDEQEALSLVLDVGQEIALQMGGLAQ